MIIFYGNEFSSCKEFDDFIADNMLSDYPGRQQCVSALNRWDGINHYIELSQEENRQLTGVIEIGDIFEYNHHMFRCIEQYTIKLECIDKI